MSKPASTKPEGSPKEVIGGGLALKVVEQIKEREKLVSGFNRDKTSFSSKKTNEHLLFFNGNGAWARLVSSVNTLTEEEANSLAESKESISASVGDISLAYNNVLMGGTLKQGTPSNPTGLGGGLAKDQHFPLEFSENGFIKKGRKDIKTTAYERYEDLGFRPTPGIETVEVKSKGTYGTLREATVKFKVWSLEDLEIMQALFLRPGYSVLLEWGHSLQLNSSTDPGSLNGNIEFYQSFLADNLKDPMLKFEKELGRIGQAADHNYDALVGYISNFEWSLTNDGGYDCSINVISKGSVLESIAVTFDTADAYPADQMTPYDEDKGKKERKSIFHKLFAEMDRWVSPSAFEDGYGVAGVTAAIVAPGIVITDDIMTGGNKEGSLADVMLGNVAALEAGITSAPQNDEARAALSNDKFNSKLNKLINGDTFTYIGIFTNSEVTFNGTAKIGGEEPSDTLASIEEEEVQQYLDKQFGMYGLVFEQAGSGDNLEIKPDPEFYPAVEKLEVELDNTLDADDYRETLRIINFIRQYAILPKNELSEDQKTNRESRLAVRAETEAEEVAAEVLAKETDAEFSGNQVSRGKLSSYSLTNFKHANAQHFKSNLGRFAAFRLESLQLKGSGVLKNDSVNEFWIPLHVVLDIYNNYVTLIDATQEANKGTKTKGRKLTQFYTGESDENPTGKFEKECKFLTSQYHFSINPMVCVLPNAPRLTKLLDSQEQPIEWPGGGTSYPIGVIWKNGFHQAVKESFASGQMRGEDDDILNILISCQLLEEELDKLIEAEEQDSDQNTGNNIVSFMKTILSKVGGALGGVNDFDLFFEEKDDMYYIVDRKVTPIMREYVPTLSLSGISSNMTDVSISSQISKNIGNMVSIAAQGTGGNSKDNVATLLKWNVGLLDRHIRHKSQKKEDTDDKVTKKENRESGEDKRLKAWAKDYQSYWNEFNGENFLDSGDFNAEIVSNLTGFHKNYCQKFVVEEYMKNPEDPKPAPGTIPVELSFTTMGIGGIKIGQAFMIEKGLLPSRYTKDFGYIITGLEHQIANSKWLTKVKTQFYSIKTPTASELEAYKKRRPQTEPYVVPVEPKPAEVIIPGDSNPIPLGPGITTTGVSSPSGFPTAGVGFTNRTVNKTQVLLHYNAGNPRTDKGYKTLQGLKKKGLCYHYIIDYNGHIEQLLPANLIAYHAGCGNSCNSKRRPANTTSIGISLLNYGYGKSETHSSYGKLKAPHKNGRLVDHNGSPVTYRKVDWAMEISDAQYHSLFTLYKRIKSENSGIPSYRWEGESTWKKLFPGIDTGEKDAISWKKDIPGFYTHCSSNTGKKDAMPTPKILKFFKELVL